MQTGKTGKLGKRTHPFSAQWLKSLTPPEKGREEWFDSACPGLVLRVSCTGSKTFTVHVRKKAKHGKGHPRVTLGKFPRMSLAAAREEANRVTGKIDAGHDFAAEREKIENEATFADLCEDYLIYHAAVNKREKGRREDERTIRNLLIPRWGRKKAKELTKGEIVEFLRSYVDLKNYRPYRRNRLKSLISMIFRIAEEAGKVSESPVVRMGKGNPEPPRKRAFSDDELRILIPIFRDLGLPGMGFRLMLLTGQRPNEVFGMRWSEIEGDLWTLPEERTKSNRQHLVPLSPQSLAILGELRAYGAEDLARKRRKHPATEPSDFVFPSRHHGKPYLVYSKEVILARRRSGFKNADDSEEQWRAYDLRKTCITGLERLGVLPHITSAVANHSRRDGASAVTTRHYAFYDYLDEKRKALKEWGDHIEGLCPTPSTELAPVVELKRRKKAI